MITTDADVDAPTTSTQTLTQALIEQNKMQVNHLAIRSSQVLMSQERAFYVCVTHPLLDWDIPCVAVASQQLHLMSLQPPGCD